MHGLLLLLHKLDMMMLIATHLQCSGQIYYIDVHIQIPPDRLSRSHVMQYAVGTFRYSAATAGIVPVPVAEEYPLRYSNLQKPQWYCII